MQDDRSPPGRDLSRPYEERVLFCGQGKVIDPLPGRDKSRLYQVAYEVAEAFVDISWMF